MDESAPAMNPLNVAIMHSVQTRTFWLLDLNGSAVSEAFNITDEPSTARSEFRRC
jgi:hypothetical protein